MKKFLKLLLIISVFLFFTILPALAGKHDDIIPLMKNLEIGERLYKMERAKLVEDARKIYEGKGGSKEQDLLYEKRLKEFYAKSRELTEKYKKPLIEAIKYKTNKGLPKQQRMRLSAGTSLYLKDQNGKLIKDPKTGEKILNDKHRGWKGDFDFAGTPESDKNLRQIIKEVDVEYRQNKAKTIKELRAKGLSNSEIRMRMGELNSSHTVTDKFASYTNVDRLDMTVNTRGNGVDPNYDKRYRPGEPGSKVHKDIVATDARAKETYASIAMEKGQPGKKAVEISDHHKKAIPGLKQKPGDLMKPENIDDLQGMVKGTLKSVKSKRGMAGRDLVKHSEVSTILKANGIQSNGASFKSKLESIKEIPELGEVVFRHVPPEKLQKTCGDLIEVAHSKADDIAKQELYTHREKIKQLETEAKSLEAQGKKTEAEKLRKKSKELKALEIDSKVRMNETRAAINEKLIGNTELVDINRSSSPIELNKSNLSPDIKKPNNIDIPSSKSLPNIGKLSIVGSKAGGLYMKLIDIKGNIEDFNDSINEALDEAKSGDSEFSTIANATGKMLMKMSGIPAVVDAIDQATKNAKQKLLDDIKKDPNLSMKDYNKLLVSYVTEEQALLVGQIAKGAAEEAINLPGNTGKFLGELSSKEDLDKANQMFEEQSHKLKMFKYRHDKLKELQNIMSNMAVNGYDDEKSKRKNELLNYFYDLHAKASPDSELDAFTSRWIDKIEVAKEEYSEAMAKKLELKEQQRKLYELQEQLEQEKQYQKAKLENKNNSTEFDWDEEGESYDYSLSSEDEYDYDNREFVPESGDVNKLISTINKNDGRADLIWSKSNQQGSNAQKEYQQAMQQIASQNQKIAQEMSQKMQQIQQSNLTEKQKQREWEKEKNTYKRKIEANGEYQQWLNKVEAMGGTQARNDAEQFAQTAANQYMKNPSGFVKNIQQQQYNAFQQQQKDKLMKEKQKEQVQQQKQKICNEYKLQLRNNYGQFLNSCSPKRGRKLLDCLMKSSNYRPGKVGDSKFMSCGLKKSSFSDLERKYDQLWNRQAQERSADEKRCAPYWDDDYERCLDNPNFTK